jgi:hypothetical protein
MSKLMGAGCGDGGPIRPRGPLPALSVTLEQSAGLPLPASALTQYQALFMRVVRYCYAATPVEDLHGTLDAALAVEFDAQGNVTSARLLAGSSGPATMPSAEAQVELRECWLTRARSLKLEPMGGPQSLRVAISLRERNPTAQ